MSKSAPLSAGNTQDEHFDPKLIKSSLLRGLNQRFVDVLRTRLNDGLHAGAYPCEKYDQSSFFRGQILSNVNTHCRTTFLLPCRPFENQGKKASCSCAS